MGQGTSEERDLSFCPGGYLRYVSHEVESAFRISRWVPLSQTRTKLHSRKEANPFGEVKGSHISRSLETQLLEMIAKLLSSLDENILIILQRLRRKRFIPSSPKLSVDFEVAYVNNGVISLVSAQVTVPSRIPYYSK